MRGEVASRPGTGKKNGFLSAEYRENQQQFSSAVGELLRGRPPFHISFFAMFNNSCLLGSALQPPTPNAPQTFLSQCPQWVIETTDAVWSPGRSAAQINRSLHEFFYEGWETTSSFGKQSKGMKTLENLVWSTKRAFPDLRIHITDVVCVGNDIDGYKTIMPDVLVGTHTGHSDLFGPPTGLSASWAGLAFCYVQRVKGKWQYVAEWVVHDELATALQLGVTGGIQPVESRAQPHDCSANLPSWGWQPEPPLAAAAPTADPIKSLQPLPSAASPTPLGKKVVQDMDAIISNHLHVFDWPAWQQAMAPFWTESFSYDSTIGSGKQVGLHDWFFGEHVTWNLAFTDVTFNQLVFAGERASATTTTYALASWRGPFAGVAPSNATVRIRICDFYRFRGERISYNWMMLDVADMMRASGRRVLPRAAVLPDEGTFLPPRAMDGLPAPLSAYTSPEEAEASRAIARELLAAEWEGALDSSALWHADEMIFYGPSGVGLARGFEEYRLHVLAPLWAAFADRRFELDTLVCEGGFCGAHGYLHATHVGCYLGESPAEGGHPRRVSLRVGMHWHIVDGKALDGYAFYDAPAFFMQLGTDLLARASMPTVPLPPACPALSAVAARLAADVQVADAAPQPPPSYSTSLLFIAATVVAASALVLAAVVSAHHAARQRLAVKREELADPLLASRVDAHPARAVA